MKKLEMLVAGATVLSAGLLMADGGFSISGGDFSAWTGTRRYVKFLRNGTMTVTGSGTVELLVVGGGGAGGVNRGGGGGGGGVIHKESFDVTEGTYEIVIGAGGEDSAGGDTTLSKGGLLLVAHGGGKGANVRSRGSDGASGGGGGGFSTTELFDGGKAVYAQDGNRGFPGGKSYENYGGGGGGAGGAGESADADHNRACAGGPGYVCAITGADIPYGAGGAGSSYAAATDAGDGFGGGGGGIAGNSGPGGKGGSGVVIVSMEQAVAEDSRDFSVTGGTEIYFDNGSCRRFESDGELTVTGSGYADILLVGGGGRGGNGSGGGGGGGGVVYVKSVYLEAGSHPVKVGLGATQDRDATASSLLDLLAYGGGNGGRLRVGGSDGASGGGGGGFGAESWSGGKALYAATGCRGFDGGKSFDIYGGGGGGAGGAGGSVDQEVSEGRTTGAGGIGFLCDITGSDVYYGGGGSGGVRDKGSDAVGPAGKGGGGLGDGAGRAGKAGEDGLGGGGGGMSGNNQSNGGNGGSGVVIVRTRKLLHKTVFDDAVGGTKKRIKGYCVHTFTTNGTFSVPHAALVEFLIVGGGGAGGAAKGGGGGAGGVVTNRMIIPAGDHPVVVGKGGVAQPYGSTTQQLGNGSPSSVFGLTALGGGGGGNIRSGGASGASGGGGAGFNASETAPGGKAQSAVPNLGSDGGSGHDASGGGGGGAGGVGSDGDATGGDGGEGVLCGISGEFKHYAGGGGGGTAAHSSAGLGGSGIGANGACYSDDVPPLPAANTGSGGGGGTCRGNTYLIGSDGADGVVIIRYERPKRGMVIIVR